MAKVQRKNRRERMLRPVHPNAGIEAAYRKRLTNEIEAMHRSIMRFLVASYRRQEDRIVAEDESPADALRKTMEELTKRWMRRFDSMAEELADYFATSVEKRSTASLRKILKDGGWTVEFKMTRAMQDIVDATVHENVALIKSIPQQYLGQVEGIVMRGATTGRDIGQIAEDLEKRLGVTRRRAAFIARDQSNKTTAAFNRARQLEVGITEAIWVHSHGGREPRKSHLAAGDAKVRFDVAKGWFDPDLGKYIWPGTEINCRCVSRPVLPGFI